MARIDVIIRATIDLDEFECDNMIELQELIEDSDGITIDITSFTGETRTADLEFASVEEN